MEGAAPAPKFKRDMAAADVLGLNMSLADCGGGATAAVALAEALGTGEAMVTRKKIRMI